MHVVQSAGYMTVSGSTRTRLTTAHVPIARIPVKPGSAALAVRSCRVVQAFATNRRIAATLRVTVTLAHYIKSEQLHNTNVKYKEVSEHEFSH